MLNSRIQIQSKEKKIKSVRVVGCGISVFMNFFAQVVSKKKQHRLEIQNMAILSFRKKMKTISSENFNFPMRNFC